jgi:predicted transcriptional regulator
MRRKLAKGIARKIILDPEISARLDTVLVSSRQPLSGFVQDAIVQRLARWEPASAFIDASGRSWGIGNKAPSTQRRAMQAAGPRSCRQRSGAWKAS